MGRGAVARVTHGSAARVRNRGIMQHDNGAKLKKQAVDYNVRKRE